MCDCPKFRKGDLIKIMGLDEDHELKDTLLECPEFERLTKALFDEASGYYGIEEAWITESSIDYAIRDPYCSLPESEYLDYLKAMFGIDG